MERRATRTRTTLAVSMLALTLIAPWALGQDLTETRRLAEQGDADAQYNLGVRYANGEGVLKDEAEAVRWYRLSADQGNADAQFNLGVGTPTARVSSRIPCSRTCGSTSLAQTGTKLPGRGGTILNVT